MKDIFKRNFDVSKEQLAHDLTMLRLQKIIDTKMGISLIYDRYIEELEDAKATIEDKTRYELPPIKD